LEIQEKYKFLRPGQTVLDLGSAPGGWSQIIAPIIKSPKDKPTLISVDLKKMDPVSKLIK
jgi:23S rRNA (uridine2552-2'-O)-methyltransferase